MTDDIAVYIVDVLINLISCIFLLLGWNGLNRAASIGRHIPITLTTVLSVSIISIALKRMF